MKGDYSFYNANFLFLLLCATGIGIFLVGMPKIHDDWLFMFFLEPWFRLQGDTAPITGGDPIHYGMPWHNFWETMVAHYYHDNARLSNYVATVLLIFPKWVGSAIPALCWVYVMWGSLKLANVNWRESALIPFAIFLWIFGLPWRDYLGSLMYQFNYVVASALCIGLLNLIRSHVLGRWGRLGLFVLAVVVGAWHEGFSAFMIAGLTMVLLLSKEVDRKNILIALTGLGIGFVWLLMCPNFFTRVDQEYVKNSRSFFVRVIKTCFWHFPSFIFLFLVGIDWLKSGWRKLCIDSLIIFITSGVIVSIGLALYIDAARAGWMGDLFAIPGILYLLNKLSPSFWNAYRRWSLIIGIVLMTGSVWTLVLVDKYTLAYKPIFEDMMVRYGKKESNLFFGDIMPDYKRPYVVSLFVNDRYIFNQDWFEVYYFAHKEVLENHWRMIPKQLENFDFEKSEILPGTAGFREVKGLLVGRAQAEIDEIVYFDVDFGPLKSRRTGAHIYKFTNSRDGQEYIMPAFFEGRFQNALFGINRVDTIR